MPPSSTRLWHPFAAMGKVDGHELVLTRGAGSRVWDAEGNEYVDATAGLWFCNVGHGRGEIADAVAAQLRALAAHHVFGDHANQPALDLARRLADLAPVDDAAVFFGTGGGEAVYWHEPGRFVQQLHGQHGGLSPQEMEIPLLAWVA